MLPHIPSACSPGNLIPSFECTCTGVTQQGITQKGVQVTCTGGPFTSFPRKRKRSRQLLQRPNAATKMSRSIIWFHFNPSPKTFASYHRAKPSNPPLPYPLATIPLRDAVPLLAPHSKAQDLQQSQQHQHCVIHSDHASGNAKRETRPRSITPPSGTYILCREGSAMISANVFPLDHQSV